MTTEEWKAEQQLERDAQASIPVPVKNMRLVPFLHDEESVQARICEQPSANVTYSTATAWPGSRLEHREELEPSVAMRVQVSKRYNQRMASLILAQDKRWRRA